MSAGNTAGASGGLVRTILVWTATVLLAALFALAGVMKLVSPDAAKGFADLGYPYWFCILIGVIEVGGALALLVPRTAFYAAVALGVVMVGAVITLLVNGNAVGAVFPFLFLVVLAAVAYARRPAFGVNRVQA
jgi:uncharacterized membrane protein YphA (DoxX/SURF4 family)